MKAKIANSLFLVAVGFLACLLLINPSCNRDKKNGVSTAHTITKTDTTYIVKYHTTYLTKTKIVPVKVLVIKRDTITREKLDTMLAVRTYTGAITKDSTTVNYTATTTGTLDSLSFTTTSPKYLRVVNTVETVTQSPKGLYLGAGISTTGTLSLNANYLQDRGMIGIDYKPIMHTSDVSRVNIRYSYKITK